MKDYSSQYIFRVRKQTMKRNVFKFWFLGGVIIGLIVIGFNLLFRGSKTYEFINPNGEILGKNNKDNNILIDNVDSLTELIQGIEDIIIDKQGIYGVFVNSLSDDFKYGINENRVFTAASINKVPIIVTYLLMVGKNTFSLSDTYRLEEKDIEYGSGTMQNREIGSMFTFDELIRFIGKYSDNIAVNVIIDRVGKDRVQELINEWGMAGTNIEGNITTPMDMGLLFSKIYKNEIFSEKDTARYFFDVLTNTDFETRIPAGVPDNIRVAHKIGNQIQVWSDCGVVFGNKPYSLCILTDGIKEAEAQEILPEISRMVWEFEKNREKL